MAHRVRMWAHRERVHLIHLVQEWWHVAVHFKLLLVWKGAH